MGHDGEIGRREMGGREMTGWDAYADADADAAHGPADLTYFPQCGLAKVNGGQSRTELTAACN